MVADGGRISSKGKCYKIKIQMNSSCGQYELISTMYAMPLGGADAVLGVQWLTTLRDITMNFRDLSIQLTSEDGQRHCIKGLVRPPTQLVSSAEAHPKRIARCDRTDILYAGIADHGTNL